MEACWRNLPGDLIDTVGLLLSADLCDLVRFAAVCRPWKERLVSTKWLGYALPLQTLRCMPSLRLPKLMLPKRREGKLNMRGFIEWKDQRRFHIDLGQEQGMRCVGSGHGWLVMLRDSTGEMNLFNPISGEMQPLPRNPDAYPNVFYREVEKAIVVMTPNDGTANIYDIWVVVLVFGDHYWLRPGYDEAWKNRSGLSCVWDDLVQHGDLVYFIDRSCSVVGLWPIDQNKSVIVHRSGKPFFAHALHSKWKKIESYIVEVGSQVMGVSREFHSNSESELMNDTLIVFRLVGSRWEEVRDLGECSIFLSDYASMALSAVPPNSQFESNCIYFAPSCKNYPGKTEAYPLYWRVYCLENGTCRRFSYDDNEDLELSSSNWVTFNAITKRFLTVI